MADNERISLCFVYFRSLTLPHLDAAWYSVSRQDFSHISQIYFLDNNTDDSLAAIRAVLDRYPIPVPVVIRSVKHGDATKTQSWSVNHVCQMAPHDGLIIFTRADYILDFDAVAAFVNMYRVHRLIEPTVEAFVTSYAYHMAYDERGDQRIEGFRDIEIHGWRTHGAQVLLTAVNGWRVESSDIDAGVWLTRRSTLAAAGWLDERLSAWGYQQTEVQQRLKAGGVEIIQLPHYLFFHQHHAAPRSYDLARQQLAEVQKLDAVQAFRPDAGTRTGSVCDELDS